MFGASVFAPDVKWSALSEFIHLAHGGRNIELRASGRVLRSYGLWGLSKVLLSYILRGNSVADIVFGLNIDVELARLAEVVADYFG